MTDITPLIPKGKKIIESYGNRAFTVSSDRYNGSIIVLPDEVIKWEITCFGDINDKTFIEIEKRAQLVEVLLLGCGKRAEFLDNKCEKFFADMGIVVEVMDTGAACRTYNVLLSEERKVAAMLIAS